MFKNAFKMHLIISYCLLKLLPLINSYNFALQNFIAAFKTVIQDDNHCLLDCKAINVLTEEKVLKWYCVYVCSKKSFKNRKIKTCIQDIIDWDYCGSHLIFVNWNKMFFNAVCFSSFLSTSWCIYIIYFRDMLPRLVYFHERGPPTKKNGLR